MKFWKLGIGIMIMTSSLFLAGCNLSMQDGDDGESHIAYSWSNSLHHLYTEDPAFANKTYITNDAYVPAIKGTYYFEYVTYDDVFWNGVYSITIKKGKAGSIFAIGEDGDNLYFDLNLNDDGPTFYETKEEYLTRAVTAESVVRSSSNVTEIKSTDGWDTTQVLTSGKYTIVLHAKRIR